MLSQTSFAAGYFYTYARIFRSAEHVEAKDAVRAHGIRENTRPCTAAGAVLLRRASNKMRVRGELNIYFEPFEL
jgi:hypothetical protein